MHRGLIQQTRGALPTRLNQQACGALPTRFNLQARGALPTRLNDGRLNSRVENPTELN
ncbi:MAG: hypothetical protein KDA47_02985 [Planctomycetales bacterium]|nr:hypothetical protein [Planctomycetales bacterium]